MSIPTLVIAGVSSGVGKTSIALGLTRVLTNRGLRVQPFKVGPDFLDPTYLTRAAGRTCYNLDGWMTSREYIWQLFTRVSGDADIAIVEGVMGMFDGSDPENNSGSTAEIAAWLGAGTILVVNSHGLARSIAPLVKGFAEFDPSVKLVGVIANYAGSTRHRAWMEAALEAENLPPLFGAVTRDSLPKLPSRHLGLVTADPQTLPESVIDKLASACEEYLDIDAIIAAAAPSELSASDSSPVSKTKQPVRIGAACDAAFHFAYPDNLEALVDAGAEVVFFSPLEDERIPDGLGGLYFPGGYPELFAAKLAANKTMLASIRAFGDSGGVVFGECGGLMYLGQAIVDSDGTEHEMVGLAPVTTRKLDNLRTLGYVEVTFGEDCLWGSAGEKLRGHEFHYSEIVAEDFEAQGWHRVYSLSRRRNQEAQAEGFARGNMLVSYVHLHWASSPQAAAAFVNRCREAVEK